MSRFSDTLYTSATITEDGNSGVLDLGGNYNNGFFAIVGTGVAGDETMAITMDFYHDIAGTVSLGTITFNTLNSGTASDVETWPGDVVSGEGIHIPRYYKLTWDVEGTGPSMSFVLHASLQGDDR